MSSAARERLDGMKRIEDVLARHVDDGSVPGLAWAVMTPQRGPELGAAGSAQRDTIFRIASMSKPITAVATMLLVEDCVLRLDDPVDDLLPELADRRVLRTPDSALDDTVPAHRPITTRDLLTFTWGLGMDFTRFGQQPVLNAMAEAGTFEIGPPKPQSFLAPDAFLADLGRYPLEHQPGDRWLYHLGSEVLGVLVARASGQPFGELLRERIFEPLGMRDTGFHVPADQLHRLTECRAGDEVFDAPDGQWSSPPPFESGGGGLVSTVDDYLAFARMLADDGGSLLSRASVELLTTNHLTPEQVAAAGSGYGFGVGVVVRRTGYEAVGAYGWTGGLGSSWTNDPASGVALLLLTSQAFTSPALPTVHQDFVTATYASLDR